MDLQMIREWGTTEHRQWLVEIFAFGNLLFLAVDVWMAHSFNDFAHPVEWVPVYFSAIVPWVLLYGIWRGDLKTGAARHVGLAVGGLSVLVGTAGLLYHLESAFFHEQTLQTLVYSAPFIAPVSYTGVGLLLLANRLSHDADWGQWIVLLSLAGFVGNFGLSLLDHAINGFFYWTEAIPVVTAAYGCAFLGVVIFDNNRRLLGITAAIMVVQILVGLLGFGLHFAANLEGVEPTMLRRFIYGAPVFAPLLFPNLAILACIGLWERLEEGGT